MATTQDTVPWSTAPKSKSSGALDTIILRNLSLQATLGGDAWNRANKPQPIVLTIELTIDTTLTAETDDVAHTFSYGQICSEIIAKIGNKSFTSLDHLTSDLASSAEHWPGEMVKISAIAPKALLRAEGGFSRELILRRVEHEAQGVKHRIWHVANHEWTIKGLKPACVIGVNPHERLEKQIVVLDLGLSGENDTDAYAEQIREGHEMWRRLVKRTLEVVEASDFLTVEALVGKVAAVILDEYQMPRVKVRCEKPSALAFVEGAGVEIVRGRELGH